MSRRTTSTTPTARPSASNGLRSARCWNARGNASRSSTTRSSGSTTARTGRATTAVRRSRPSAWPPCPPRVRASTARRPTAADCDGYRSGLPASSRAAGTGPEEEREHQLRGVDLRRPRPELVLELREGLPGPRMTAAFDDVEHRRRITAGPRSPHDMPRYPRFVVGGIAPVVLRPSPHRLVDAERFRHAVGYIALPVVVVRDASRVQPTAGVREDRVGGPGERDDRYGPPVARFEVLLARHRSDRGDAVREPA